MIETLGTLMSAGRDALALGADVAIKATVLLVLAFSIQLALGRGRALIRSAFWNACLLALLLLPASSLYVPRLVLPLPRLERHPEAASSNSAIPKSSIPEIRPADEPGIAALAITMPRDAAPLRHASIEARPLPQSRDFPGQPDRNRPHPIEIIVPVAYLTGVLLLIARLTASLATIARLGRQCDPLEEGLWPEALEHWRVRLGIGRRVALRRSDRVSVPVVIGWIRPAIVVPDRLAGTTRQAVVDSILLHELCHVRRGDYGWNLVRKLVQCLYWPHPLVWPLGRSIGAVREQSCDDLCIHILGGASAYRATLLDVAAGLVRRPDPALGLAMARATNLGSRLAWIDRSGGASRCLMRPPARFALATGAVALAGLIGSVEFVQAGLEQTAQKPVNSPAEKPPATPQEPPASVEVVVIAKETGKPLKNATVQATIGMSDAEGKTDDQGIFRIDLSRSLFQNTLSIDIWAEGYVQQRHFFSQDDLRSPKIPSQITIGLLPGEETLGGTVTDEGGRPIAEVKVKIWGYLGEKKEKSELAYMVDAFTNAKGQWRCRCFRSMTFAYLYLSHPDYLADGGRHPRLHGRPTPSSPAHKDERPMSVLRDFTDVQVMKKGVGLTGRVVDEQERPVPGAEVGWIEAEQYDTFHDDVQTTTTGATGEFRFSHVRPGRLAIQVKARGHAPALASVEAKVAAEPIVVTLEPAKSLAGRVEDRKGKPIPDAMIVVDTWRGYRSLGVYLKSDAEGHFRWDDAPSDSVLIDASRAGYNAVLRKSVSPDEKEVVLTLRRSLSISGKVHDAQTNQAIERARVETGVVDPESGEVRWGGGRPSHVLQGRLSAGLEADEPAAYRLRILARGYQPFETRTIRTDERDVELEIKLTKAAVDDANILKGTVRRPDGQPLAGAEVVLTYPIGGRERLPSVHIEDGKLRPGQDQTIVKTDASGRFSIAREPDPAGQYYAVVVVHPDYYAEVGRAAFQQDPAIAAKPWCRVEGTIRVNSRPARGAEVGYYADRLGNSDVPYISDRGKTTADARGHFVLKRIVPGDVRVFRGYSDPSRHGDFQGWSNGTLIEARSGETVQAEVGGKGRPVIARVALPEGFDPKADYTLRSEFEIESDRRSIPYPKDVLAKRDNTMVEWGKKWWASAEGHDYRRNWFRLGQAKLEPDGTIRADDVPPGDYVLRLRYTARTSAGLVLGGADPSVSATKRFTVPPIPGGSSFEPLDLGVLKPEVGKDVRGRGLP